MSHVSLFELTIEHLRGSVIPFTLPFEKAKKLTIVYGENGTGKSTICDALDLLGNGKVGSLDGRGLGATRQYWHSVGKNSTDVKVTLKTSGGECVVSLGKKDIVVVNAAHRPNVEVLRRSQILSLVEAKPAERYAAISRFIDVSAVETSEASLRKLILDIDRDLDQAITRVVDNRAHIDGFWSEAGKPYGDSRTWASQEILKDQEVFEQRKSTIDKLITLWDSLESYPLKSQDFAAALDTAREAAKTAQEFYDQLTGQIAGDYLQVLDILRAAQQHFNNHPSPSVCPLCESSERAGGLVAEINRRIEAQSVVGKLDEARSALSINDESVKAADQRVKDLLNSARDDACKLEQQCAGELFLSGLIQPSFPMPSSVDQWGEWFNKNSDLRQKWQEESDSCVDAKRFIGALRTSWDTLEKNEERVNELGALAPLLKRTLSIAEIKRREYTDSILGQIASRVGELYEAIHPGEGLNKITLELDAAKRASLEISTEFAGKTNTPPQAYFSDSHLDTFGLCVFFALAEREAPEDTILVLDDVLGSVDEPHVDRVIGMLYDETAKFRHCLITTHYGPWRHKYRWGWLKNGQCHFVELTRWSIHKGISHSRSIPEADRLRVLLTESSPDLQAICAKSGVILEATMDFLTQLYESSVPRRAGGSYTLGDLLPAIDGKLKKALRVEHRQESIDGSVSYVDRLLEPHITELMRIAQVRNVFGCHFNALSFDLLDSDAMVFGQEVLSLLDALVDHKCGWPRNGKSGSYWATAGETRRLHPLRRPG